MSMLQFPFPMYEETTDTRVVGLRRDVEQLKRRAGPDDSARFIIKVFSDTTVVTTGDGKFIFAIPEDVDAYVLDQVEAWVTTVSSSGIVQVQIRNITNGNVDMLSTRVQVDASEKNSKTAATAKVINAANDVVLWADEIAIDVDAAGTGAKGLGITLGFIPPEFATT